MGLIDIGQKGVIHDHDRDFWWPKWGVKIYLIVTGVTSEVGVLSTRLFGIKPSSPIWMHFDKMFQENILRKSSKNIHVIFAEMIM